MWKFSSITNPHTFVFASAFESNDHDRSTAINWLWSENHKCWWYQDPYNLSPSSLRHTFWQYRKENPQTRVGEPPPDGLPGFNSGVMLLDLGAMRASALYNQLLEPGNVAKLADQYRFRGHLGDQDFFTMIGMEHPELFYSLTCGWNRQLCTWWRDHGYGDVFQLYYRCGGPVYIYHGNCNSPIPDDWCWNWKEVWHLQFSKREILLLLFG